MIAWRLKRSSIKSIARGRLGVVDGDLDVAWRNEPGFTSGAWVSGDHRRLRQYGFWLATESIMWTGVKVGRSSLMQTSATRFEAEVACDR